MHGNLHNRHIMTYPWRLNMSCLLCVYYFIHILSQSLLCCMQHHVILNLVITAPTILHTALCWYVHCGYCISSSDLFARLLQGCIAGTGRFVVGVKSLAYDIYFSAFPVLWNIASLPVSQSYDWPTGREVTEKDITKPTDTNTQQNTTKREPCAWF